MIQITPAIPPRLTPPPMITVTGSRELGGNDTGHDVKDWQDALVELGYLTKTQLATAPGVFGPATEAATRRFQADHSVALSGRVGAATHEAMQRARAEVNEFKQHTLHRGMKNESVRLLKRDLVTLGLMKQETYDAHPSTYGSGTEDAVIKFQREHGLVVSGKVGVATRMKLAQVLASRTPSSRTPAVRHISQFISAMPGSFCGPTTVTMIARAFGKLTGVGDAAAINWLAAQAGVGAAGTGWQGVQKMARSAGLSASDPMFGSDLEWVNTQLAAGKLIAASGGRWLVVCGRGANGDYLVQDPSTDCKGLSPSDLRRFFTSREGGGVGLAIG